MRLSFDPHESEHKAARLGTLQGPRPNVIMCQCIALCSYLCENVVALVAFVSKLHISARRKRDPLEIVKPGLATVRGREHTTSAFLASSASVPCRQLVPERNSSATYIAVFLPVSRSPSSPLVPLGRTTSSVAMNELVFEHEYAPLVHRLAVYENNSDGTSQLSACLRSGSCASCMPMSEFARRAAGHLVYANGRCAR